MAASTTCTGDVGLKEDDNQTSLHTAVGNEDTEVVGTLSGRTREVNIKDNEGKTPLHYAVICGDSEAIKILLQKGEDLDIQDHDGNTPLHYAIYNCLDVAETLLENGANVELQNCLSKTPLHIAVDERYVATNRQQYAMSILLNRGAKINVRDFVGQTPLHIILQCRSFESTPVELVKVLLDNKKTPLHFSSDCPYYQEPSLHVAAGQDMDANDHEPLCKCKELMDQGASPDVPDRYDMTPLHYAVMRDDSREVVELLVNASTDVNCRDNNGVTPLMYACSTHAMKLLLQKGAEVNAQDSEGRTPLHHVVWSWSVESTQVEAVKVLLDNGADINCNDTSGITPLHLASDSSGCKVAEFKYLLEMGARVNAEDNEKQTPLHVAAVKNLDAGDSLWKCKALIDQGASPDVQNLRGMTPLFYAVIQDRREVVELLVNAGAYVNSRDNGGRTPLFFSSSLNSREVAELLLNVGADMNCRNNNGETPLHLAVINRRREIVELLVNAGADVNYRYNNGETPLLCAVKTGSREVVELMVNAGADVNCRYNNGETLLRCAVNKGCREVVELLVNAGADVNCRYNGMTPLMYTRSIHVMKLLLQKGAEVNAQDCEGRTPLHFMAGLTEFTLDDRVSELLDWGASLTAKDKSGNTPIKNWSFEYKMHAVKRACANLHTELTSESNSSYNWHLETFQDSCREEVERMKQKKFGKHSLYEVFRQYRDPRYLNNIELERGVKLNSLNEEFPIYDSLLKSTYTRAKERVDLCEVIVNILETPLPREVMMHILTFVDHESLFHIITASKETMCDF